MGDELLKVPVESWNAKVDEIVTLRAKVAELEKWKGDIKDAMNRCSRKDLAHELVGLRRGFAIRERERDQWKASYAGSVERARNLRKERDALQAKVAELEDSPAALLGLGMERASLEMEVLRAKLAEVEKERDAARAIVTLQSATDKDAQLSTLKEKLKHAEKRIDTLTYHYNALDKERENLQRRLSEREAYEETLRREAMLERRAPKADTLEEACNAPNARLAALEERVNRHLLERDMAREKEQERAGVNDELRTRLTAVWSVENEIDCRIDHGADSNGHLEAILVLLRKALSETGGA